ncbi:MAG: helix-turn-helix transcriptional regulator [Saprospiraceae bacterium]|jgi:putative transcriptional regulator|nr:helix-turn-helix transcriptional regulator [Saprospiraceae bacterium]
MKNNIKIERSRHNITQADLAEVVGISRQSINSIETGKFIPSVVLAIKISQYFKLPVEDVFILEDL